MQHGIRAEEEKKIREACENISVTLAYEGGVQKVLLNGEDISDQIRQEEVGIWHLLQVVMDLSVQNF